MENMYYGLFLSFTIRTIVFYVGNENYVILVLHKMSFDAIHILKNRKIYIKNRKIYITIWTCIGPITLDWFEVTLCVK